jgi:tetratricopeptide (TPR) repeat protein
LERGQEVIDQFQIKALEYQVHVVRARISEAQGDYAAMEAHYSLALENIKQSVYARDLSHVVPRVYAELAKAQIETGKLDAANRSIETGFGLDRSEPALWVAKGRLQRAQEMPELALASVNYALALWNEADREYVSANEARILARELQDFSH